MAGEKISAMNNAVHETLPHMRTAADDNANAQVLVRVVRFSSGAQWAVAQETPIDQFHWTDLEADGVTDMGHALQLVAEVLKTPPMPSRALPPVLVLLSDGQPTDDFNSGLKALMDQPWGKRAVRIAIAIGKDADRDLLQKFIGHPELKPLEANSMEQLVRQIKWVSTQVLKGVISPATQTNVPIPTPPPDQGPISDKDVW